jgi:uncharacterized protein YdeI (YjbR/CyaY-like superfamily)
MMKPIFFSQSSFRTWLEKYHDTKDEVWVGMYHVKSGKMKISYKEAVDEALCFGWIDAVRKKCGPDCYMQRFTPRRKRSTWSIYNTKRVAELAKEKRMRASGLKVFKERDMARSGIYSFEQKKEPALDSAFEKKFSANRKAREYFQSKPPSYRKPAIHWVMSAKKEETRIKRLEELIRDSAKGTTIKPLTRNSWRTAV